LNYSIQIPYSEAALKQQMQIMPMHPRTQHTPIIM